jgi:hypothetical protein
MAPAPSPVVTPVIPPQAPARDLAPSRARGSAGSAWALRPAESQPVAAVRLPRRSFSDVRDGLRDAGFAVLDILAQETGPAPLVLVLALPPEREPADRLLAAGAGGPARVLIVEDREQLAGARLRPGVDEVVEDPCHPLQVAAAALRVSGAPEHQLGHWSESVFARVSAR